MIQRSFPLAANRKPPKGAPTFAYKPELKGELGITRQSIQWQKWMKKPKGLSFMGTTLL